MAGLFISYRRQDSAAYAGRLYSDLTDRYGNENVLLDVADISPGQDFAATLRAAVAACKSVLVVIGPQWLDATDVNGQRRIDDPSDFIRREVGQALLSGKPVIPVLVGGAAMPRSDDLPPDLRRLPMFMGVQLNHQRWQSDLTLLWPVLDEVMGPASAPPRAHARRASAPFMNRLAQAFAILVGRGGDRPESVEPVLDRSATSSDLTATPASRHSPPSIPGSRPESGPDQLAGSITAPSHDIFVSYSSEDRPLVERIVASIESESRRCWVAYRDIPPGVPAWAEPIVTAIASSRLVLVLLTTNSIPSIEVLREVTLAADERIPLLPVTLDRTPLSAGLRYYFVAGQRLDLSGASPAEQVRRIAPAVAARFAT